MKTTEPTLKIPSSLPAVHPQLRFNPILGAYQFRGSAGQVIEVDGQTVFPTRREAAEALELQVEKAAA